MKDVEMVGGPKDGLVLRVDDNVERVQFPVFSVEPLAPAPLIRFREPGELPDGVTLEYLVYQRDPKDRTKMVVCE